ncbi:MAG TPA: GNAT family N-acetyltransferase [Chitinophagaceae bacterium]|nr:GNAT family N-acetyltransferase [Chitinophagaceae bacterium]
MSHLLDNMIWNAINSGDSDKAIVDGDAGCYREDIAPFAGLKELHKANLDKLHELIIPNRKVAISYFGTISIDQNKWQRRQPMECCQMVYACPVEKFTTKNSQQVVPLADEHIQQMLELTALTKPGPFLQRTIDFNNYFGVFVDGRLAAMTGQRMHPTPYMEVSAVCTHPDFRGQGYAKACMLHVMQLILDNSFIPFLHVLASNATAIRLYESIGFRVRTGINIEMIKRR